MSIAGETDKVVRIPRDAAVLRDRLRQHLEDTVLGRRESTHVGRQIAAALQGRSPQPFSYRDPGIMATVGKAEAVLQLPNGLPAWLAWIFIHVTYLLGGRNRASVPLNFFWRYAGPRRSATSVSQ